MVREVESVPAVTVGNPATRTGNCVSCTSVFCFSGGIKRVTDIDVHPTNHRRGKRGRLGERVAVQHVINKNVGPTDAVQIRFKNRADAGRRALIKRYDIWFLRFALRNPAIEKLFKSQ